MAQEFVSLFMEKKTKKVNNLKCIEMQIENVPTYMVIPF